MADNIADELLEKIGGIAADLKTVHERTISMDGKLMDLIRSDVGHERDIAAAHRRIDEINKDTNENVKPMLMNHEAHKNKVLGVVGFIGFLCTGFGAAIIYMLQKVGIITP